VVASLDADVIKILVRVVAVANAICERFVGGRPA
jgi:hypothetical protein